ncbi:hypothetical protein RFF05_10805 [Bengtsoniella intestinalis]|uniref:hypothetical protein n=1 Tax=Bengtsoniella intestinalis TaxID=3073143 RepID=UPI00391F3783
MNQNQKPHNTRPVVTYILILFTAAFFIMAFSLLANQRSNDQTLDELRQSISSLEEGQTAQGHVLTLQEELDLLQEQVFNLTKEVETLNTTNAEQIEEYELLSKQYNCLSLFFQLEMTFQSGDYTACLSTMQDMDDNGLIDLLPTTGTPSPAQRFEEIKLAVLNP